jgi:hypothetical protein
MALDWVGMSSSFIMELSCEVWEIKRGLPTSPVGIFQASIVFNHIFMAPCVQVPVILLLLNDKSYLYREIRGASPHLR